MCNWVDKASRQPFGGHGKSSQIGADPPLGMDNDWVYHMNPSI